MKEVAQALARLVWISTAEREQVETKLKILSQRAVSRPCATMPLIMALLRGVPLWRRALRRRIYMEFEIARLSCGQALAEAEAERNKA